MPSGKSEPLTIDLTPLMLKSMGGRRRKLGRYSASEIYKMITPGLPWGLPASKYFEIEEPTPEGAMRMMNGIINHEQVQRYLDPTKNEIKKEYSYGPFVLVGKADHLPDDDTVWEIKTSDTAMTKSKPWHDHQAKLYCTMFERSKGYILQPMIEDDRLILREVGFVERDDEWFEGEMQKLLNYHERLELIANDMKYAADTQPTLVGR